MLHHFNWFWRNFIAPEFLTEKLKRNPDRLCPENEIIALGKNIHRADMFIKIAFETSVTFSVIFRKICREFIFK